MVGAALLVLALAVLLPINDEMLAVVEKLTIVEIGITAVLLCRVRMHLADLAVIAPVIVLGHQRFALRFRRILLDNILHREVAFLLPLSRVLFSPASNRVLDRGLEAVLLVRERRARLHLLLLCLLECLLLQQL